MHSGLNFHYIRNVAGHPVVCIASLTVEDSLTVSFQIATHNPKDEFQRKYARAAAGGRLAKKPVSFKAENSNMTLKSLVYRICKYLVNTQYRGVKIGPIGREAVESYIWDVDNEF